MIVIPAIDLKGGRCVRLFQGRMDQETVYSDKPSEVALRWKEAGAERLHVVDLDGAVEGRPVHFDAIREICRVAAIPIQVGGGIRRMAEIESYVDIGVHRVILGSAVIHDQSFVEAAASRFPGRIAVGIDATDGWVAVRGWAEVTKVRALDLARRIDPLGFGAIIFTDIQRDGTLQGPNREALAELCRSIQTPVIASGGVSSLQDIRDLLPLVKEGLEGAIVGKALYAGTLDLTEAIAATREAV